jgi:hypothetical protein
VFHAPHAVHPEPGWHEHDPSIYTAEIDKCIAACLELFETKGHSRDKLKGVGIATHLALGPRNGRTALQRRFVPSRNRFPPLLSGKS